MNKVFRKRFFVRLDDVDYVRVLYFPRQIHFFMIALEDFFREAVGITWNEMLDQDRLVMPTVNVQVSYHHPLKFGDEGEITIRVLHLGSKSLRFEYAVTDLKTGRQTCIAQHTMAFVEGENWRTVPIPDKYRDVLRPYLVSEAEQPQ